MKKKTAYEFDPELKKYAKLRIPVMPRLLPLIRPVMGALYHGQRSNAMAEVKKLRISTRDGYAMRALLYTPTGIAPDGPCLIYYHGGGFVYPCAPHEYLLTRRLAAGVPAKALLIDYRLAPKHRFPVAVQDAYDAYLWAISHAGVLGINPQKLLLGGDSAGGNLAAAVCLMARDMKQPLPRGQLLLYPFVDRDLESESMRRYHDTPLCDAPAAKVFIQSYASDAVDAHPEYFAPLEAAVLQGLPPVYMETAEFDCLLSGGLRYAKRLREAGQVVELNEVKGAMHGYDIAYNSKLVKKLMDERIDFLRRQLAD